MGRQLFLHHYLPAHLASCLVAGAVVEFVFNIETADLVDPKRTSTLKERDDAGRSFPKRPVRERVLGQSMVATWAACGVIVAVCGWSFWFFAPLTYGRPGLSVEEVVRRKWLGYDLHFAK